MLSHIDEFNYLGVLIMSEGRRDWTTDRWIGASRVVMRMLYQSVVVKTKLGVKAKGSVYQLIYIPTLIYGHEFWVTTERMKSHIQVMKRDGTFGRGSELSRYTTVLNGAR